MEDLNTLKNIEIGQNLELEIIEIMEITEIIDNTLTNQDFV